VAGDFPVDSVTIVGTFEKLALVRLHHVLSAIEIAVRLLDKMLI